MKSILIIFCFIAILLCSCHHEQQVFRSTGRDLTTAEKNFIPYQLNDTCSFSNGKGGLLTYTCTQRTDARYDIKIRGCGSKDDACYIDNEENLDINLDCSNTIYNVKIKIYNNGNSFKLNFYNQPNKDYDFDSPLYADALCPLTYYCLDSLIINSKKYYKVGKLVGYAYVMTQVDTVYYTSSVGLLRFCMADSTVWTKR